MPVQIREKHLSTEEELRVQLEVERAENEDLRRQLREMHDQIESIGAGGVSLMGNRHG